MRKSLLPFMLFLALSLALPFGCSKKESFQKNSLEGKSGFSKKINLGGRNAIYDIDQSLNETLSIYPQGNYPIKILNFRGDEKIDDIIIGKKEWTRDEWIQINNGEIEYNKVIFPDKKIVDEMIRDANRYMQMARNMVADDLKNYKSSLAITENPLK